MHRGHGFSERNELGDSVLEFAVACNLVIKNTYFKKREDHLITYNHIDFFLLRKKV